MCNNVFSSYVLNTTTTQQKEMLRVARRFVDIILLMHNDMNMRDTAAVRSLTTQRAFIKPTSREEQNQMRQRHINRHVHCIGEGINRHVHCIGEGILKSMLLFYTIMYKYI